MEKGNADDREYVKQKEFVPAAPRRPGDIESHRTPGCPPRTDAGIQRQVEKIREDSSGLP